MSSVYGPRTLEAVAYVKAHPGCSKADVTRCTGASYDSVQRAIRHNLVSEQPAPGGRWTLTATRYGLEALR